ncbi:MAG: cation-transporting P-type ATPase [Balneolaceae bacterium]|nr:cation-transporting P-type ATPase [Balneolaceae bacterium]MCH8547663.1 cation-transporting P-type ATPase [Balneolaceae bacterium]
MEETSEQLEGKIKPWHSLSAESVIDELNTNEKGISEEEAAKRLEEYGPNKLPEGKKRSALMRFLIQFHNVLIYVLIMAAVITALLDHWIDTWVILAVVLVNAVIGFVQEGKAEQALEGIRKMLSLHATVLRDGERKDVEAEDLVPGDVVLLESGDKVPADVRLIHTRNFRVEESALTGESVAVEKHTEAVEENSVPGDRLSMAFSGTSVVYGRATGIVASTGADTELGKINRMMSDVEEITTPLLKQIDEFGKALSLIIIGVTGLFFAIGYFFRDYSLDELFMAVISLAVAAIPEGLPAIMTITLAVGVQAMARRNAIIRRLPSVETLGSVSVICSDKTGTLTKNEMTVTSFTTAEGTYDVQGTGYSPEGGITLHDEPVNGDSKLFNRLMQTVMACNDAQLRKSEDKWSIDGDPTEGALITLAHKAGFGNFKPERIDSIPFESDHKYMATLNSVDGERLILMKGAPERLLDICANQLVPDGTQELNHSFWEEEMERQAGEGRRLIAAAYRKADDSRDGIDHEDVREGMTFLGLFGIIDPPRPEAIESIRLCKQAGIEVKMITGDHVKTASAIGLELGIGDGVKAISGHELEKMSDEELKEAAAEYDVFARTSPEHKLRLVTALQAKGKICAMTGDGVNDAPALKRADVGIAMGIKGTEVTKDASEMVLADDNFASIANAVEEGRTIYDNLRKAILFILPTNGAESFVIMAAVLMGIALPITPVQILWVNMITAVTLALALSFEPSEPGVMKRPPRDTNAGILGGYFLWRVAFVSLLIGGLTLSLYYWLKDMGYDLEEARTVAVNTLVAGQLFYLFNCRRMNDPSIGSGFFGNKYAFYAVGVLIIFQMIFTYAPFMNEWFGTTPHAFWYWVYPLSGGFLVFMIVELEKYLIGQSRAAKRRKIAESSE